MGPLQDERYYAVSVGISQLFLAPISTSMLKPNVNKILTERLNACYNACTLMEPSLRKVQKNYDGRGLSIPIVRGQPLFSY
jgi:hydroxylamine reductase (hybrid-cluster protein)